MYYQAIFIDGYGWIVQNMPDVSGLFRDLTKEYFVKSILANFYESFVIIEFENGDVFTVPKKFVKAYKKYVNEV